MLLLLYCGIGRLALALQRELCGHVPLVRWFPYSGASASRILPGRALGLKCWAGARNGYFSFLFYVDSTISIVYVQVVALTVVIWLISLTQSPFILGDQVDG